MSISKSIAIKLWEDVFGVDAVWAMDCFGTWMYKHDYGETSKPKIRPGGNGREYDYGWTIDHIMPLSKDGKNDWNNLEPMHYVNNQSKGNNISFKINGIPYQVVVCSLSPRKGYGILNVQIQERVDWKWVQKRWYV